MAHRLKSIARSIVKRDPTSFDANSDMEFESFDEFMKDFEDK